MMVNKVRFLFFMVMGCGSLFAQVDPIEHDSIKVDTTIVETYVLRSHQEKIKYSVKSDEKSGLNWPDFLFF